jgi:SPP1 family phage portal protein
MGGKYIKEKGEVFDQGQVVELQNPQPHQFDRVPITEIFANARKQSVFEKVKGLIEAQDIAKSDWLNEIVEFKQSYLKVTGGVMEEEERKKARGTRIINIPDRESDADFLTKELSPEFVENFLKMNDADIYKFSKTLNMGDEKTVGGGAQSGESRKWRMLSLIFLGMVIEVFFTKGLRRLYKVEASYWNKFSTKVDPLKIKFEFTRKLPSDLLYAAEVMEKFWGKLPKEVIYKLMPFIENVQEILEQYEAEYGVDLDNIPANIDDGNTQ